MLAAVMKSLNEPLQVEDVPTPTPGAGEVRIRIRASGLCSSDLHYIKGDSPVSKMPIILGHEVAGVVDETGPDITTVSTGDRVAVHYLITCGTCELCRSGNENFCSTCQMIGKTIDGGFAQYIVVPEANAIAVPSGVPIEYAALAGDAIATPYHAVKLACVKEGDTVMILGLGGLGVHAVQIPKLFGAATVIAVDVSEAKLELVRRFGADHTINPSRQDLIEAIRRITDGKGVDVAIELIGLKETLEAAIRSLAPRGRMVVVGICPEKIEVDSYNDILLKEAVVTGNCDHLASDIREILPLIEQKRLDLSRSVSRRISLSEINEGLRILRSREKDPVRIVITEME
jgi:propanol-preferring alcohol dehydrogenase